MCRRCLLFVVLLTFLARPGAGIAEEHLLTFDDKQLPASMEIEGGVSIDRTKDRSGKAGAALRVGPGARAVWQIRKGAGSGKVELWVFDDGSAPTNAKKHAAGPMWGLLQQEGPVLTVGAVYAPYLSGDTTYAASDFQPTKEERPWWQVQYLGLRRKPGWHKWTFDFHAKEGLKILYDDQDLNARRQVFNWNKTRLLGFTGVVIFGDSTDARQTLMVDDIKVELGPPAEVAPLWPPPPPPSLVTVPPRGQQTAAPYAAWDHGLSKDSDYFPIAVWLQIS